MHYLYGEFTDEQINKTVISMHSDIHKLLLYKDRNITEQIFNSEEDFVNYFANLLFRFGGLNELLGEPKEMVDFMSTLQSAFDEVTSDNFQYKVFRRAILDCHGYIKAMFEGVDDNAEFING
jgi:hypothetical protein